MQHKLILPLELLQLIETGHWPTRENVSKQNIRQVIGAERLKKLAPEEHHLYLEPPPFTPVAVLRDQNRAFWEQDGALDQIIPERTLVIGDFGPGSDTVLALDYCDTRTDPAVIRLLWRGAYGTSNNKWVLMAKTFREFADALDLWNARFD
ncbi:MAG TPA: hypothetical protein VEJ63_10960 [Planctomycetota bacterium]|nr:hypothetical protein [Planctomycetota bacterium]